MDSFDQPEHHQPLELIIFHSNEVTRKIVKMKVRYYERIPVNEYQKVAMELTKNSSESALDFIRSMTVNPMAQEEKSSDVSEVKPAKTKPATKKRPRRTIRVLDDDDDEEEEEDRDDKAYRLIGQPKDKFICFQQPIKRSRRSIAAMNQDNRSDEEDTKKTLSPERRKAKYEISDKFWHDLVIEQLSLRRQDEEEQQRKTSGHKFVRS